MSFITSPGIIVPPLTAGGVAYGTGSQAKVTSAGTVGQVLTSNGAGVPTFSTLAGGGVTSVAMTVPSLLSVSGSPITSSGTLAVSYSGTALPIANGGTNSTATPTAGGAGYGTGTAHAYTAAGTSGQLLKSNGASAPTWATVGSSAMVYIQDITMSGTSQNIAIDNSTYSAYRLYVYNLSTSAGAGGKDVYIRINSISTATYNWAVIRVANGTIAGTSISGANQIQCNRTGELYLGNSDYSADMIIDIYNIKSTGQSTNKTNAINWSLFNPVGASAAYYTVGSGGSPTAITSIQISFDTAQALLGTIQVYGIV